ncbi:hypothetical protein GCM10022210_49450 [Mucilaginibacter dorajii]|uniref:Atrophied bacterial Ig domain-containing protein n=2 Tax=Mucilaginibacter dorajii TaxID=692994 RepID=A0ABP7QYU9_9SPHI
MGLFLLASQIVFCQTKQPGFPARNKKTDRAKVAEDAGALRIPNGYADNLHWDIPLDTLGQNGSIIHWKSGDESYVTSLGKLLKRSPRNGKKVSVTMKAIISLGNAVRTKSFNIYIAYEELPYSGYLFAYFEGSGEAAQQEQLRFGVSADAFNWNALNGNRPVLSSTEISQTGGIRDPHILRGEEENSFYMVATDMSAIKNGWGHNPGIDMLKSGNLIDWSHSIIDLAKTYPENFSDVKWVWAPQTIYDPAAGKYLVYFTVRFQNDPRLDFYSAYANKDFTGFEHEPALMFRAKYGAIDGDIIYKDGVYHFFFKGNTKDENGKEVQNGIQQAIGHSLQGPWAENFKYLDAYSTKHIVVEGSGIFKLNNSETYVLMYDLYTRLRYEYQKSSDLYHFTENPESFTKNFNPRHGTVISITREEAKRLNERWGGVPPELLK